MMGIGSLDAELPNRVFGAYPGIVRDREDPESRYRIRAEIPGFVSLTDWALPFGTMGGGSAQRGGWTVPAIGSTVLVMFLGGDIERPIYTPGWWGAEEMPQNAKGEPKAHDVQCLQFGSMVVTFDERQGSRKFSLEDTVSGDQIVWDLEKQGLSINMSSAVLIKCDGLVDTKASQVTINGRLVTTSSKAI